MKLHTLIAAAFLASTAITPVLAASENIGGAAIVVNQVNGALAAGRSVVVNQGDGIYRDEVVRTNTNSNTKLVLVDSTSLSIGPSSSIKLDRFVYAGPSRPGRIALNFVKGALLFATGNAAKEAYSITTPTAALGVRGTVLKITSTASKTVVDLVEGAVHVCMRSATNRRCVDLTRPGQEAVVTVTQVAVSEGASNGLGTTGGGTTIGNTRGSPSSTPGGGTSGGTTGSSSGSTTGSSSGGTTGGSTSVGNGQGNGNGHGVGEGGNNGHGHGGSDGGNGNGNGGGHGGGR